MAAARHGDANERTDGALPRVLVSACLLGQSVRFDGRDKFTDDPRLARWREQGRVVPVCPEVAGGLPVPLRPAEIHGVGAGAWVLDGGARVVDDRGQDVTHAFVAGAQQALALVRAHSIRVAVLKARSPSCGRGAVYDGSFAGRAVAGNGVTAELLQRAGVRVFDETSIEAADRCLRELARDRA